jgi:hypothetical protein
VSVSFDVRQELGLVGGGEVTEALDVLLLAISAPAAVAPGENGHDANPGKARGSIRLENIVNRWDAVARRARVFNDTLCSQGDDLLGGQAGGETCSLGVGARGVGTGSVVLLLAARSPGAALAAW